MKKSKKQNTVLKKDKNVALNMDEADCSNCKTKNSLFVSVAGGDFICSKCLAKYGK